MSGVTIGFWQCGQQACDSTSSAALSGAGRESIFSPSANCEAGFAKNGGRLASTIYDENSLNINQPNEIEGLASCLDYFKTVAAEDPGSAKIQASYDSQFPGKFVFSAGSAATGTYRGLKLWAAAVKEANSLDRTPCAARESRACRQSVLVREPLR